MEMLDCFRLWVFAVREVEVGVYSLPEVSSGLGELGGKSPAESRSVVFEVTCVSVRGSGTLPRARVVIGIIEGLQRAGL